MAKRVVEGCQRSLSHDNSVDGTTEPNDVVAPIHPKAMPVILTTPEEIEVWMTAPANEALMLQRPLTDSALQIVARGQKEDGGLATPYAPPAQPLMI